MNKKGLSLIEVLLAVVILGIVSLTMIYIQSFMSRHSVRINERVFATQKVIQMMEELRSLVAGSEKTNINVLDDYDDGTTYQTILTTNRTVTDPSNLLSGNAKVNGTWKYIRQVSVIKVPDDPFARQVYVKVYRNSLTNPGKPKEVLAQTVSILKTISSQFVPTQSMDVYIISIENVPGWWSSLSTMRPTFESVLQDLQMRNPGLVLQPHWITRLAYGRDTQYVPYINSDNHTTDIAMPNVYFYPGLTTVPADNSDYFYYDPTIIQSAINIDGTVTNANSYPLADMYNHAVRYPDEVALYNQAVAKAQAAGQYPPEISLRMLIENLNSNAAAYKNILLINLHGELLPLPPMRNYSDAAKDPADFKNVRIVTHPEKLQYPAGGEVRLRVYPYLAVPNAQYFNDSSGNHLVNPPAVQRTDTAVNFNWNGNSPTSGISGTNFSARWSGVIQPRFNENYTFTTVTDDGVRLYVGGTKIIDQWIDQAATTMTATISLTAGQTYPVVMEYYQHSGTSLAQLFWASPSQSKEIVPLTTLPVATVLLPNDYLNASNSQYFDGNLSNGEITVTAVYGNDLGVNYSSAAVVHAASAADVPYGVPSWTISNPSSTSTVISLYYSPLVHPRSAGGGGLSASRLLYGMEYIPCPVGNDFSQDLTNTQDVPKNTARWIIRFSTGTLSNGMHTVETRIGSDLTTGIAGNEPSNNSRTYVWVGSTPSVPVTELYQFMGDPRHCPYLDVKQNNGYNWYFTSVNSTDYPGFGNATSGWGVDQNDIDVPRFCQVIRQGLLRTQAIWSAMNGFSYYYYGMGGEFGSDVDPLPYGVRFQKTPWSTTSDMSLVNVDEILPYAHSTDYNYARVVAKTDNSWYAKYWLGELYPDSDYATWNSEGNIHTGTGNYYRTTHDTFTDFGRKRTPRTATDGCGSFFNGASGGKPFNHNPDNNDLGLLTNNVGLPMSSNFNFPLLAAIACWRPFTLNGTDYPPEWNNSVYSNMRTALSIPSINSNSRIYYTSQNSSPNCNASAAVKVVQGTNTCYVVVSGLATQSDFGSAQMGKYVLMSMLQTFLDGGMYSGQDKISQVPLLSVTNPTISDSFINPSTIHVAWTTSWLRWDGQKYTSDYASNYSEATALVYSVKYSNDNGRTWKYCSDDSATAFGTKDYPGHTISSTSYDWPVSTFAKGSYIVRVEGFRRDINFHYTYDQVQVYINK